MSLLGSVSDSVLGQVFADQEATFTWERRSTTSPSGRSVSGYTASGTPVHGHLIRALPGAGVIVGGQEQQNATHILVLRVDPGLAPGDRLVLSGTRYYVQSVLRSNGTLTSVTRAALIQRRDL